jgi:uncharacterized protein (DUF305 family)
MEERMKTALLTSAAFALALLTAACGSNEQAAQTEPSGNGTNATTTDASGPFAQSEMQMNQRMMAAVGTDVEDTWVRKMIEHHQGAIDMSRIVLAQSPSAGAAEMARMTVEKQGKEIEDLRKLVKPGAPNLQTGEPYRAAMTQMHDAMMSATGADVSETFLRKMLEHHKGGVTMSDIALQNGVSGALRQRVQKVRDDQQKEATMVEAMLRGETMQAAMQQAGLSSAAAPQAATRPAAQAAPASKAEPKGAPAATKAAPKAAPKAPAPPPAKAEPKAPAAPTCTAEHRALGHC